MNGPKSLKSSIRSFIYPPEVLLSEQFAYGHREIYVEAFGFQKNTFFLAEIQHGWAYNLKNIHQYTSKERLRDKYFKSYPLLVWSDDIALKLKSEGMKKVFSIKSPWSLLVDSMKSDFNNLIHLKEPEFKDSAIYFPTHSYPGFSTNMLEEGNKFAFIQKKFNKITTCLYWLDFINPKIRSFFSNFSEVTCAGYRASSPQESPWHDNGGRKEFLFNLYNLISSHEYVLCDELSTACMASLTLEKKVILVRENVQHRNLDKNHKIRLETIDNLEFLTKNSIELSRTELGYELYKNKRLLEIAKEGFGFNLSLNQSREILFSVRKHSKILENSQRIE